LIAHQPEILVPHLRERGDQVLDVAPANRYAGMHNASPSGDFRPRFRDKRDLMSALQARAQQNLFEAIQPARSITEACRIAIEFTIAHGHVYELIAKDWGARLSSEGPYTLF
jgi:hypothetical protein